MIRNKILISKDEVILT